MKILNVAIMGLGTVGGGTYRILTENHDAIAQNQGVDIRVVKVLELNVERALSLGLRRDQIAANIDEIASDPSIDTVVEVMGREEPARTFMIRCFEGGKNVVTANKECVAKHWAELEAAARAHGVGLYFEASCVGGVPVIRTLTEGMQANNIREIMGIFNGTTNYILSQMTLCGADYAAALGEAQRLGYAEADPTADVEGFDTMYKLSILSSLAFHTCVPYTAIAREGISRLTAADIESARELGYVVKLLAVGRRSGDEIDVRVQPTFVPKDHPLASVSGSFNAMFIKGDMVDDIMLYGRGAGDLPTGSAIVSDIVYSAGLSAPKYTSFDNNGKLSPEITVVCDYLSKFFFAADCPDTPGVLGRVTTVLGSHGVSVDSVIQRSHRGDRATVVFLTHATHAQAIRAALGELAAYVNVKSLIHVI